MDKLFIALLSIVVSSSLVPHTAVGQEPLEFKVGNAIPPIPWSIELDEINKIDVDFDLQGRDPDFFSYNVDQSRCDTVDNSVDIDDYSGSVADGIVVEFRNPTPVIDSSYCFTVNLVFAANDDPVHTKTFTFRVTARESGSVMGIEETIAANDLQVESVTSEESSEEASEDRPDPEIAVSTTDSTLTPIVFGGGGGADSSDDADDTVSLKVTGNPSWYFEITSIAVNYPSGGPGLTTVALPSSLTKGESIVTFKIPLFYFAEATENKSLELILNVDWDINGRRQRQRRRFLLEAGAGASSSLQEEEETESGVGNLEYYYWDEIKAKIELAPLLVAKGEESGAYNAKIVVSSSRLVMRTVIMTVLVGGGAIAVLFV